MKRNLTLKENIVVASMLFGLFFGAGNLIFPVSMGQQAGSQMWPAFLGFSSPAWACRCWASPRSASAEHRSL